MKWLEISHMVKNALMDDAISVSAFVRSEVWTELFKSVALGATVVGFDMEVMELNRNTISFLTFSKRGVDIASLTGHAPGFT